MTVYLVISLPKNVCTPYMYIVLANPSDATLSLHLTHFGQVVSKET
jgi:hypothetical protein